MRLRSRLLILVVALLVPAVLAAAFSVGYIYSEQHKAYRKTIQDLSRAMALLLDKEILEHEMLLQTLAASPSLTRNELPAFYEHAKQLASSWDTTIFLSDLTGQQLLNTRAPLGTKNLPKSKPLMPLRQKYGPDVTIVSDTYFAPIGKNYSFAVQVPVKRDGQTLYYLGIGSFTSRLQSVFKQRAIPSNWIGTVIDRNGIVAARTHEAASFVGKPVREGFIQVLNEREDGFYDGVALHGVPVTAFFSRAPDSQWRLSISVPQSELRQNAIQATALIVGISLLLLGLGVATALAVARKTSKPMEALRRAAAKLGQGELIAMPASSGIIEMDAVNREMARASEQIYNAKSELEQRVADAVAAAERSQRALMQAQKLEALGRLTGGIAHDFNNVLQTLSTGLQIAHYSATEPRAKKSLEACQRAVQRAGELTRQLMAFGRVQDAHLQTVDLPRQIEEIKPMLRGGLRGNIELQLDISEHAWPVTIDALQFELAMLNLSINARDAMPSGGVLTIRVKNTNLKEAAHGLIPGEYVEIAVGDTGQGMDQEVLSKALDPFFTTKAVGHGSGMGLPQAYGFAKQSGGTLTIDSRLTEGTTVTFFLPKAIAGIELTPQPEAKPLSGIARGKLLFVEDDPLVMDVVVPALEAAGFTVRVVQNGEAAVALLKQGELFDIVFSDIVMPGKVNGVELAEMMQKEFPGIGIVLASGYSERRAAIPGVRILAKPYDITEAVDALSAELAAQTN